MEIKVVDGTIYIESDTRSYIIHPNEREELIINSEYSEIGVKPYAENRIGVMCTPDKRKIAKQKSKKTEG